MVKVPFTKQGYLSVITEAKKKGYVLSSFKDAEQNISKGRLVIVLRHDIDLDLDAAVLMAELENKLNIRSTYFVLLYNDFYNPLSPLEKIKIKQIRKLGHEIGLHWDSRDYVGKPQTSFARSIELLSEVVGEKIVSGSQHEPVETSRMAAPKILQYEAYRDFQSYTYISDSSMKWRQYTPLDLINRRESFQFLAHPFWWMMEGDTMKRKFTSFARLRKSKDNKMIQDYYNDTRSFLLNRKKLDKKFNYKGKQ